MYIFGNKLIDLPFTLTKMLDIVGKSILMCVFDVLFYGSANSSMKNCHFTSICRKLSYEKF